MPAGSTLLDIEGSGYINFCQDGRHEISSATEPSLTVDYLLSLRSLAYQYENYKLSSEAAFLKLFSQAKSAWQNKVSKLGIRPIHSIYFRVYDKLPIDQHGNVDIADGLSLGDEGSLLCLHAHQNTDGQHIIHIEKSALIAAMQHGFILKQILSGSLAIQYRRPDVFDVATNFSFTFFGISQ